MPAAPYNVTNSFKAGLMMRTYSRNVRRAWDGEDIPIVKRPCVEKKKVTNENEDNLERAIRETSVAISSSPSRKNSTIFSQTSHDDDTLTPPSSPPPCLSPPVVAVRKPTFSFLKRKHDAIRDESEPLGEVINSSIRTSTPPAPPPPSPRRKSPPPPAAKKQHALIQMQLDFGVETRKTCPDCSMEYVPSNEEDATLHRMYHNMNSEGVELGKTFMRSAMKWAYEVSHIEGCVVVVDRKISPPAKKIVQKVLGVVNKELSATEIDDSILWSQRSLGEANGDVRPNIKQSEAEKRNDHKSDRYKIFLHVKEGKCVGMCLAERITKAHRVKAAIEKKSQGKDSSIRHKSSSISIEEETVPAVVGVSRIWTSKSSRRKGIANNLLDCVMNQFIYGMDIDKDELAFSQPTESGGELARAWYGEESGWLVYKEA